MSEDLVYRLRKRAEIRRQISTRKSVQEGKPDRIADLLEEAATRIYDLEQALGNHPPMKCPPGAHGPEPTEPCDVCGWLGYVRDLFKKTVEKVLPKPVIEHAEGCEGLHCSRCGYCESTADGYNPCICYAR